jgi:8-oxo-dGTP pyrophosphatase MutT (NUDIX family)
MKENSKNNSSNSSKFRTLEQISAGGVAFRHTGSEVEIAIISVNPNRRWQLPKGLIDDGETPETAALREVREEAGIETDLLAPIEKIEYWYVADQRGEHVRFHKSVHFFLMAYRGGAVEDHDHEVIEARWVKIKEALEMLAFKGEKGVVEKAENLISQLNDQ